MIIVNIPETDTREAIMIQKTNMTIDVYLRNAGLKSVRTTNRKDFIPLKNSPVLSFSEALDAATSPGTSESSEKNKGLTISDYFKQAIPRGSTRRFQPPPLHSFSRDPVSMNTDGTSYGKHAASGSSSHDCSAESDAGDPPQTDSRTRIADSIEDAARKYNLPGKLIESVIQAESGFRVDAVSPAGAQGLMQLMPGTAKELGVDDPFDARQNIDGGAAYLRQMLDRFDGDVKLALAAYNAGPGTVEKYNGNVPYRETQNYIERVLKGMSA
jgi:hypothetical protein